MSTLDSKDGWGFYATTTPKELPKERLEEVMNFLNENKYTHGREAAAHIAHQQARIAELERLSETLGEQTAKMNNAHDLMRAENARLREALGKIAEGDYDSACDWMSQIAHGALGE